MNLIESNEQIELKKNEAYRIILWERYKFWCSEINQYFRLVMQFTIWYYGITGAILAFVLNKPTPGDLKIAFLLPGIMGILSGCAYFYFAWRLRFTNDDLERLAAKLFTFTNNEMKLIHTIFIKEEYQTKPHHERIAVALKEARRAYGIDGNYSFNTAHHLQVILVMLGLTHMLIGAFSIHLYFGIGISLFIFIIALVGSGVFCWRSDVAYKNSAQSEPQNETCNQSTPN